MTPSHRRFLTMLGLCTALGAVACATSPTGRKQLLLLPEDQMNVMGAQAFDQAKKATPTESNPAWTEYVRCVATPLQVSARDKLDVKSWEVVVFKDDTPNAFALPGGKIGVHTGLFKVALNDAQLAAVLGHEVGHVIARHGNERVSEAGLAQGGLTVLNAILGGGQGDTKRDLLLAALGVGAQVGVLMPHGRNQESEADIIGLDLMARSGFDPQQSVELWKNMIKATQGGSPPEFLSTHPASENRIKNLESKMAETMPKYQKAVETSKTPVCHRPS